MKKYIFIAFVIFLNFYVYSAEDISLLSISGVVQFKETENAKWVKASVGQKLSAGFFIYTGFDSNAVIQTPNAKIEVKPLSQVSIASLIADKKNIVTDVYLKYGKVKANIEKNAEVKTLFKVRSANSTASVRGTYFGFGNDEATVENGVVNLTNANGSSVLVQVGENASAGFMQPLGTPAKNKELGSSVNFLPLGISGAEFGNIKDIGGNNSSSNIIISKTEVIIRIVVVP
jgi:hypothetical protein